MANPYRRQAPSGGAANPPPRTDFRVTPNPNLKLLEQVREVMRLKHYSIRTERCYCDWIRRYVKFHGMRSRTDLDGPEAKIELFLSELAVKGNVAVSTQNQAFNALLFLYREVLHRELGSIQALRATRPVRVPIVLTTEEVRAVIQAMSGTPQLVVKLQYGSGLRLMETLRLRIQDVDFGMKQITVRDGKGFKDRSAQLRNACPSARSGHPHGAGIARPRGRFNHHDLHSRAPHRRLRHEKSAGLSLRSPREVKSLRSYRPYGTSVWLAPLAYKANDAHHLRRANDPQVVTDAEIRSRTEHLPQERDCVLLLHGRGGSVRGIAPE